MSHPGWVLLTIGASLTAIGLAWLLALVGKITGRYYHRTGQFVFLFPVDELSSAKSIGNQRCLAVETLHEIMNSFQLELLETLFN